MDINDKNPLVSILTPCYNTGCYIHRLLESILGQTYSNIEMFVIDDGSTDNSKEVIEKYIPKFNSRGYSLTYFFQENQGQSVAIRNGLKMVTGKYLVWPDSDDYYSSPLAIEKMVSAFQRATEDVGMVRTLERLVEDETMAEIRVLGKDNREKKTDLFLDCLLGLNDYYYTPGAYMLNLDILFSILCGREIWTCHDAGQNWQLMLPMLLHHKCLTINEPLYSVVRRKESHSRTAKDYKETIRRVETHKNVRLHTLTGLDFSRKELEKYSRLVLRQADEELMKVSFVADDRDVYLKAGEEANMYSALHFGHRIAFFIFKRSEFIFHFLSKCRRIIKDVRIRK